MIGLQPIGDAGLSAYSVSWAFLVLMAILAGLIATSSITTFIIGLFPKRWLTKTRRDRIGLVAYVAVAAGLIALGAPAGYRVYRELNDSKVRAPAVDANGPAVHAVDVDGDGVPEFLAVESSQTKLDANGKATEVSKSPTLVAIPSDQSSTTVLAATITAVLALAGTALKVGIDQYGAWRASKSSDSSATLSTPFFAKPLGAATTSPASGARTVDD